MVVAPMGPPHLMVDENQLEGAPVNYVTKMNGGGKRRRRKRTNRKRRSTKRKMRRSKGKRTKYKTSSFKKASIKHSSKKRKDLESFRAKLKKYNIL